MSNSNFKDPIGLFKRMWKSGDPTARFVIFREFLRIAVIPLDYILRVFDLLLLKKSPATSNLPIIIILGGARSGTTLLYQTLAHYLHVSFFNNFVSNFPNSALTIQRWTQRFLKPKLNFSNYYGSVKGLSAPNDGFPIWNQWLGNDRKGGTIVVNQESESRMKGFFNSWLNITGKPFLNKNNRNTYCVKLFLKLFSNAYFIEITRDPVYVVQSLILSRLLVQGDKNIGWGLGSRESSSKDQPYAYIDDICLQVKEVEEYLKSVRKMVPNDRYYRLTYEEFCENPVDHVHKIVEQIPNLQANLSSDTQLKFSVTNEQKLHDNEFRRIKEKVSMYFAESLVQPEG